MLQRALGWTGVSLPVMGQGTWQMEEDGRAECIDAIRAGIDAGMTHIDTAELYGSGEVEELVGEAIAGLRERVFLVSKVIPQNATFKGTLAACEKSLRRLRTERLELYLLHWPGPHPVEETFRAFERLEKEGKIRFFGVSNFDERELDAAVRIAGEHRIACNQVLYHLLERAIEHRVVSACARHDIAVVGYSPFGAGNFPQPPHPGAAVLQEIGRARGATPRQIALAFLSRSAPSAFAIPKSGSAARVRENAAAGDLSLDADEIRRIDAAFPLGEDSGVLPTT